MFYEDEEEGEDENIILVDILRTPHSNLTAYFIYLIRCATPLFQQRIMNSIDYISQVI